MGEETGKKGYKGGLVLEPEVGMYENYVVLVDFNSLYPSIIRNFNICFTTVQRNLLEYDGGLNKKAKKVEEKDYIKTDQEVNVDAQQNEEVDYLGRIRNSRIEKINGEYKEVQNTETPILVRIVSVLIQKRKQVKGYLKNKNLSKEDRRKFDIMQMAYKLTANSIYGCLGFPSSRFYSRLIADTVTGLGRQLLVQSKQKVEESGYRVIYGDTDSIMINTESENIREAVYEANKIKSMINNMFRKKKKTGREVEIEDAETSARYNEKYNKNLKIIEEDNKTHVPKKIKKREIGGEDGILQVGIDGVYKKLLLIKKKKYAGLMVTNWNEVAMRKESHEKTKLEMKGLDVVRRDCSQITRQITQKAIEIVLYHENYLELLESHLIAYKNALENFGKAFNKTKTEVEALAPGEKLKRPQAIQYKVNANKKPLFTEKSQNLQIESTREQIKNSQSQNGSTEVRLPYDYVRISLNSFVIKKMLNKNLKRYSDVNNMPHVMVAKYLMEKQNKNEEELVGRFIPYIITETEKSITGLGKKAKHITAIKKSNANVDIEWYKCNQIKNVLSRTINVVPNIDDEFIDKMLGIESNKMSIQNDQYDKFDPVLSKISYLPKYFRKMLTKFGIKKGRLTKIFNAVCRSESCLGCCVFNIRCPKSEQRFDSDELHLRLETTLNKLQFEYRQSLKISIVGNPFEIAPLLDKDITDAFKSQYDTIDGYFQRIHVCFYVYFLLFKIALVTLNQESQNQKLNQNVRGLDILEYEKYISEKGFKNILNIVNVKLQGFRTNYLSELIDLNQIKA